jgi:hypothetical protein
MAAEKDVGHRGATEELVGAVTKVDRRPGRPGVGEQQRRRWLRSASEQGHGERGKVAGNWLHEARARYL